MFVVLENEQIMSHEITETYEQYVPYGNLYDVRSVDMETETVYRWYKFDLEKGKYMPAVFNRKMIIDGVEYTPINGIVTRPKEGV